ncbi:hypothetical protein L873DRAFT_1805792 [Choiromyces venosus 120613-1]|uniref:SWIM-type domain-containing protein n=1 Tax=Choiromyces venosus 120613-1 TaxID=1336337 RepID=A0A3N4JV49_9PEZI|nr:hypothetical protein L873DRAFT_1805792 [Choiromyces venosus 120613-1]
MSTQQSTPLPSPRQIITSLANQIKSLPLPSPTESPPSNPLKSVPASARQLFMSLHCLLPSAFLPALDLLDKSLVTRYTIDSGKSVYYVKSTQSLSRGKFSTAGPVYEVRTKAWSCSCSGFAFSAFGALGVWEEGEQEVSVGGGGGEDGWRWGGKIRGGSPPVCKHLVACVLAERCSEMLGEYVIEKRVGLEELVEMAYL